MVLCSHQQRQAVYPRLRPYPNPIYAIPWSPTGASGLDLGLILGAAYSSHAPLLSLETTLPPGLTPWPYPLALPTSLQDVQTWKSTYQKEIDQLKALLLSYGMLTLCSGCAYPGADSVAVQKQLSEQQQASEQALAAKQTELDALSAGDGAREAQLQARHVV